MKISHISKALLAASSLFLSYTTSCTEITSRSDIKKLPYIKTKQFNANNPIEDRIAVFEMERVKGVAVSVFDGHGGDLCADYVAGNLEKALNARIKSNLKGG